MNLILFGALFISNLSNNEFIRTLGIWFISLQLTLSYFCAGIAKLYSTTWRDGTALIKIFSTSFYGNKSVYLFLKNNIQINKVLAWVTILFECLFPFVLFSNFEIKIFIFAEKIILILIPYFV